MTRRRLPCRYSAHRCGACAIRRTLPAKRNSEDTKGFCVRYLRGVRRLGATELNLASSNNPAFDAHAQAPAQTSAPRRIDRKYCREIRIACIYESANGIKASGLATVGSGVKPAQPRSRTFRQQGRCAPGTRSTRRGILVPPRGEARAVLATCRATSVGTSRVPCVSLPATEQVSPCLSRFLPCGERPPAAKPLQRPNQVRLHPDFRSSGQRERRAPQAGAPLPFSEVRRLQETWKDSSLVD